MDARLKPGRPVDIGVRAMTALADQGFLDLGACGSNTA